MEQWHSRTIQELREAHAQEVELLKQEKEQALAEETQATLAALDAMRKAHVAEVRELYCNQIIEYYTTKERKKTGFSSHCSETLFFFS